jgi:hypothetical protein
MITLAARLEETTLHQPFSFFFKFLGLVDQAQLGG